jgi:hypothetical protein
MTNSKNTNKSIYIEKVISILQFTKMNYSNQSEIRNQRLLIATAIAETRKILIIKEVYDIFNLTLKFM